MSSQRLRPARDSTRIASALILLLVVLITPLIAGCAEEEVVDCFYIGGIDRYCVKVRESTRCTVDLSSDRVRCTDKDGNVTYPDEFNFDDGKIWLPN